MASSIIIEDRFVNGARHQVENVYTALNNHSSFNREWPRGCRTYTNNGRKGNSSKICPQPQIFASFQPQSNGSLLSFYLIPYYHHHRLSQLKEALFHPTIAHIAQIAMVTGSLPYFPVYIATHTQTGFDITRNPRCNMITMRSADRSNRNAPYIYVQS